MAQGSGGVKQGLALQLLVGVDLDLDLAAKPVGDKLPDRRDAGLEIGNAVGDEADVQRLALEMPGRPGQRAGGQGVMLNKNSAQVKKIHLRKQLRGVAAGKLHLVQVIKRGDGVRRVVQLPGGQIAARRQLDADPALGRVQVDMLHRGVRQGVRRGELGEKGLKCYIHTQSPQSLSIYASSAGRSWS